jgi:DNA-binding transcriptional ArsR family regulator
MAVEANWELNLFHSDPTLLERSPDGDYTRAAATIELLADPDRLRLLHALSVGEDTAQRVAVWAGLPQAYAERELAALAHAGLLQRRSAPANPGPGDPGGPTFSPRDGHLVVALHVVLAHGRETAAERHPRLLARRRGPRALSKVG